MKKLILALSICATSALFANEANYNWEFTPVIGAVLPEYNHGKQSLTYGARIARNIGEGYFIDQVELGYDYSKLKLDGFDEKANLHIYQLNLIKNLVNFTNDFKLYGLIGAGYADAKGLAKGAFAQYGLGLKYYWTDNFSTKLEARHAIAFPKEKDGHKLGRINTLLYSLGFGFDFGAKNVAPVVVPVGDSDGDGVPDNIDRCPNTPANVVVDEYGCEKVLRLKLDVNFKFDSAEISPKFMGEIEKVSQFMKEHPGYTALLEGHTDSIGAKAYNQKLSLRRANAVSKAIQSFGIDKARITTVGLGESNPVASNKTKEGRAENRRVDAKFRK